MTDQDPRLVAAIELLRRTGAQSVQIRYSDDEEPTIWMAVAEYWVDDEGRPIKEKREVRYETAAAMSPLWAVLRLCEQAIDGGHCMHCHRMAGFSEDHQALPFPEDVCWYAWDPELSVFRRGCE